MRDGDGQLDRRRFLGDAAAAASAAFVASHSAPLMACTPHSSSPGDDPDAAKRAAGSHRLLALRLLTASPLDEMKQFYNGLLGLPILAQGEDEITIGAGLTRLTFVKTKPDQGSPWYHVAFNIPENKLFIARKWQLQRTPLKPRPPSTTTHPDFSDVADFRNWNAHAVFFYDPAGNLLEYIARHDLKNAAEGPFTTKDILYASEIGLISRDVPVASARIREALAWPLYRGAAAEFQPIGDEHGLIIVFPTGRNWGTKDGGPRGTEIYPTEVSVRGAQDKPFALPELPYRIISAPSAPPR